ncbi:MAG TPA: triose-phosphate isomerase [Gemmatimonadaceae bacterium]|nr:triose-phosphate isomerase [Gemmatimonadaceae bacterium]
MKRPLFAANWKLNHGPQEARTFLTKFTALVPRRADRTFIFFPPALSLTVSGFALRERSEILVGVQNIHWEDKGAFTGENSAPMSRDAGAKIALVGHSERRHLFGETDEMTAKKTAAAYRAGLTVMLCVGERLEERERNTTQAVVLRQLKAGIARLEPSQIATIAIAYEPVWAIGTGRNATPEDATNVHSAIRRALKEAIGSKSADIPILYGGSVNAENAKALLDAPEVDGVLVGGASLDAEGWAKICQT